MIELSSFLIAALGTFPKIAVQGTESGNFVEVESDL